jgi:hypothetical protein
LLLEYVIVFVNLSFYELWNVCEVTNRRYNCLLPFAVETLVGDAYIRRVKESQILFPLAPWNV